LEITVTGQQVGYWTNPSLWDNLRTVILWLGHRKWEHGRRALESLARYGGRECPFLFEARSSDLDK